MLSENLSDARLTKNGLLVVLLGRSALTNTVCSVFVTNRMAKKCLVRNRVEENPVLRSGFIVFFAVKGINLVLFSQNPRHKIITSSLYLTVYSPCILDSTSTDFFQSYIIRNLKPCETGSTVIQCTRNCP